MYTTGWVLVREFQSHTEATKYLSVSGSNVSANLYKKTKTIKWFVLRWHPEIEDDNL